jgi:hypothetical protein
MELIRRQQEFESRKFSIKCEEVLTACEQRDCDNYSGNSHPIQMPPCNHDFASHDIRVEPYNTFGLLPVWYREERNFEQLCRAIFHQCKQRQCEHDCKHDVASMDALANALGKNRFELVPFWRQDPDSALLQKQKESTLYLPAYPVDHQIQTLRTPLWEPDHGLEGVPAWDPTHHIEDDEFYTDIYRMFQHLNSIINCLWCEYVDVDEGWLDESLLSLNTILFLTMAGGSRRFTRATEGVLAKLILKHKRGSFIDVDLLWNNHPRSLHDLPIRHVLPRHPAEENIGDPVLFIRGSRKGQFGTVHAARDERMMVSEVKGKGRRRAKIPEPTEYSKYDLTLCQWPKNIS